MKTLLIIGAALAPIAVVFAADETPKPQSLTPVVVTGTRSAEPENRLPAAVTVITREQIQRSGANHLVEVIRSSGIAQVSGSLGDADHALVDIRGFGDNAHSNTLILVDGRRLNNPDIAGPDLNSISIKDVERVEIIQGSAGVLYGDQAVGGVINIITRAPEKLTAQAELTAGSNRNFGSRVQGSQRIGAFAYRLSAEERGSNNYRYHNATEYRNFFGYGEYNYLTDSRVFAEVDYADEDLEYAGALTLAQMQQNRRQVQPSAPNNYADTRTKNFRIGLDQEIIGGWRLLSEGTHRNSHTDGFLGGGFAQDREINGWTPRIVGKFAMPHGQAQLTLGADGQKSRYAIKFASGAQSNDQDLRDLYAQAILPLPAALEATVGLRTARVDNEASSFGSRSYFHDTQQAWEAGLAWRPLASTRVFARVDRNYRFSKVDEFTNINTACEPNRPLCTQTGRSYELGSEWSDKQWNVALSLYRLDINKEITFDPTAGAFGANFNLPETRRYGQTLRLGWEPINALRLAATYTHLDASVRAGSLAGREIPLVASQTGTISAETDLPLQLVAHAELVALSNQTFGSDFNNTLAKLPGYVVTNLALSRNTGSWQFTARLNNLFDVRYSEYGVRSFAGQPTFYPSPEINGLLTVRYVY